MRDALIVLGICFLGFAVLVHFFPRAECRPGYVRVADACVFGYKP